MQDLLIRATMRHFFFEWSSSLSFMSSFSQSDIVFRLTKIVTGFVTPSRRAAQTEKPHKTPLIIPPCGLRLCVSINASCLILHTVVFNFVHLLCLVLCFFMAFYVFCTSLWSFCLSMTSFLRYFFCQFLSHFGVWVILRLNLVVLYLLLICFAFAF